MSTPSTPPLSVQGRTQRFRKMAEMLLDGECLTIRAGVGHPITYKDEREFFTWLGGEGFLNSTGHRATACLMYAEYLENEEWT